MLSIIAILEYTTPSYKVICIGVIQHIEFWWESSRHSMLTSFFDHIKVLDRRTDFYYLGAYSFNLWNLYNSEIIWQ